MIDAFAEAVGIPMDTVHCKAVFGKGFVNGVPVFLAKPQTYINLSGESTLVEVHTTGNLKFSCLRKYGSLHFPSGRMAKHQSDRIKTFLEELNDFPKLLCSKPIQLTDKVTEQYLEEYGIVDAASFLLERVGDVGSALMLILSGLNEKFIVLEASIGPSDSRPKHFNSILKEEEVNDILDILHSCSGLCQRNSPRLDPHESEYLWFQLLDSFCLPLMDSCSSKTRSIHQEDIEVLEVQ
ncbi:vacuolar protein sorting-associated protein 8 homolog isoform X2 [Coffea eugenioides]|nr:vacuolar protein sorting-associated protein 8 homolog isoform X2 [Coffea eugenioides]